MTNQQPLSVPGAPNMEQGSGIELARCVLPAGDLDATVRFFIDILGFRLDGIMPADDPRVAQLSGYGLQLVLDASCQGHAGVLRLGTTLDDGREPVVAPNGTRIEFEPAVLPMQMPPLQSRLGVLHDDGAPGAWKTGRAGMQYRDLIPDRQGGRFIASHIRIPDGGPVGDHVHHHAIQLQLIYCRRGWVRLAYEDQGEPFVMRAGDCVLQPPHIRHRVLESSDGLEVIEISSPAEHMTLLDHQLTLPTGRHLPQRDYAGQRFVFHQASQARWNDDADSGLTCRDLGITTATHGQATARVMQRAAGRAAPTRTTRQDQAFAFSFLLEGSMRLQVAARPPVMLTAGDAFVIPAGIEQTFADCSTDWAILQLFARA